MHGERIPIWIANYVLMEYGSGAIMAVPAHDERDLAFAQKYNIEVIEVIDTSSSSAVMINSGPVTGMTVTAAKQAIIAQLQSSGIRLKHNIAIDWGISRQRYWGVPILYFIVLNVNYYLFQIALTCCASRKY